ncbi:MAG: polyprenyl synthetase family protein, partial [Tepidanaerobacteraceae bacterium]|nr:polyprenyl synthetase family protein [Tepidanaerobacteraceae bacterium]
DFGIGIKDYITRISYKTASLTSLSCYAGARTANLPDDQIRLSVRMGHDFGKAYQIRDDIFDFLGDEDLLKKPPSDLAQGTVTLPMIFLLKKIGKEDGEKVTREPYLCHPLKIDAVKEAADYCNRLLVRSLKHLRFFPPCPIKQKMVKTLEKVHINT